MQRERKGENEQCRDQETPGHSEGDEWSRGQENWTGGGEGMKMEKGSRYQETQIVSYGQVINKAGRERETKRKIRHAYPQSF